MTLDEALERIEILTLERDWWKSADTLRDALFTRNEMHNLRIDRGRVYSEEEMDKAIARVREIHAMRADLRRRLKDKGVEV